MKLLQGTILCLLLSSLCSGLDDAGTLFSYCSDGVDQKSLVGGSEPQFTFRKPPLRGRRSSAFAELSVCAWTGGCVEKAPQRGCLFS